MPRVEAAEIALVGSFDPYADDVAQRAVTDDLVRAVERAGHEATRLQDLSDVLARTADDVLYEALVGDLEGDLGAAAALIDQGRFGAAEAVLDRVRGRIEAAAPIVPVTAARVALAVHDAITRLAQGDEVGTEQALGVVAALSPYRVPERVSGDPDLRLRFEAVRGAAVAAPATLELTAEARRATIRLDGRPAGALPRTLDNLVPGTHDVHLRSADGRVGWRQVAVGRGEIVELSVPLGAPTLGERAVDPEGRADRLRALMAPLGRALGVDVILIVGRVDDGRLVGQLYDARAGVFGRGVQGPDAVSMWNALEPEIDAVRTRDPLPLDPSSNLALATALRLPPAPGLATIDPMDPDLSPMRRGATGMWIGIGAGAAAAVALGVTLGILLRDPQPAPEGYGTVLIGPPR